jgi:hypothetical protein
MRSQRRAAVEASFIVRSFCVRLALDCRSICSCWAGLPGVGQVRGRAGEQVGGCGHEQAIKRDGGQMGE